MKTYYNIKVLNTFFVALVYLTCGVYSCAKSQGLHRISDRGIEVSYGLHHFAKHGIDNKFSSIAPSTRGISIGYSMGNSLVKGRVRGLGFYQSTSRATTPFLTYEAEALLNFYPLEFKRTRQNILDIYLLAGLNFNHLEKGFKSTGSHSVGNSLSQQIGGGIEYLLRRERKVTYLFAELTLGTPFKFNEQQADGLGSLPAIRSALNIGVRYGFQKPGNAKMRI